MLWLKDPWAGLIINGIAAITALIALIRCAWSGEKQWIRWLGIIGLPIIVVAIALNILVHWDSARTHNEHRKVAYERLSQGTSQFLSLIAEMITAASDSWLPMNEGELFSRRSIDLICHNLNIDGQGPEEFSFGPQDSMSDFYRKFPQGMKWYERIEYSTNRYRSILNKAIESYSCCITSNLYKNIYELDKSLALSPLLNLSAQRPRIRKIHPTFYPTLCINVEDTLEDIFNKLSVLINEIKEGENHFQFISRMESQRVMAKFKPTNLSRSRFEFTGKEIENRTDALKKVSFSAYPSNTYINGNEFGNEGIKEIIPVPSIGPYCRNLSPAILKPNTYGAKYSFLTTADKDVIKYCNDRVLLIVFSAPARQVKLLFKGIGDIYELRAYSEDGEIIAKESNSDHKIEIISKHVNIAWIEFGGRRGLTMLSSLEFRE